MTRPTSAFYQKGNKVKSKALAKASKQPPSSDPPESSEESVQGKKKKGKKGKGKEKEKPAEPESSSSDELSGSEDTSGPKVPAKRGRPSSSPAPEKVLKKPRHPDPPTVKPYSAAFAKSMRALDPTANEATRIKLKFEWLYNAIRIIPRLGSLAVDWANVLVTGLANYHLDDDLQPFWDCQGYDVVVEAHQHFPLFLERIKGFENHIDWLVDNPDVMAQVADFTEKVALKVRGDDLARLRPMVIELARIPNGDRALNDKANRGWESVHTSALLVPVRHLNQFRKDPTAFCRLAKKGEIRILSGDWPAMLYDMDKYDPKDFKAGLLRSPISLAAYRLLFISKTYAEGNGAPQSGSKGQPPLAKKYNLKAVTLGSIIYTLVLIRSCLTAESQWNANDGKFWNCHDFAWTLFEYAFSNADWCDELLAWWNRKIYGNIDDDEEYQAELCETTFAVAMLQSGGPRKRAVLPAATPGTSRSGSPPEQDGGKTNAKASGSAKTGTKMGADDHDTSAEGSKHISKITHELMDLTELP